MPLAPSVDNATLQTWLADARTKYHLLMTGQSVVEVMVDGYQTKFNRPDADKLAAYISFLEQQIAGRARPTGIGILF